MLKFRKTISLSYFMTEVLLRTCAEFYALRKKSLLTARIRSDDKCCFDDLILESDKKL